MNPKFQACSLCIGPGRKPELLCFFFSCEGSYLLFIKMFKIVKREISKSMLQVLLSLNSKVKLPQLTCVLFLFIIAQSKDMVMNIPQKQEK